MPHPAAGARTIGARAARLGFTTFCGLVLLFLIAPLLVVVPLSFNAEPYFTFTEGMLRLDPDAWSLRWYRNVAQDGEWHRALANSLVIGIAATALATLLGTLAALIAREFDNNIYTQIGIVLLIGLASKNAILIVEFARAEREKGLAIVDAALEAARLRFRPILMTAISSIAGFMPLVIATGAGAASRQAVGTAVIGGMIAATIMSLLFTPVFYRVMQGLGERIAGKSGKGKGKAPAEQPAE